jgi:hypothetical protein
MQVSVREIVLVKEINFLVTQPISMSPTVITKSGGNELDYGVSISSF